MTGKIINEKQESLPGVILELRQIADSALVKVHVTDMNGLFDFQNIKAGSYFLKLTLIGYAGNFSEEIVFDGTSRQLLPIKMRETSLMLKEASVTAFKPLVEIRSDKTVFNVDNSINSTGNTAMELLQKAPGVVVDNNDNILLKGRSGVMIQIDGKESRISGQDLADYLKSIQSVEVESIELISNPSSKYEAQGTAGIINIKLKKNKNYGTNGSITLGYALASFSKYNTALSINKRTNKVSLFGNYSNNWGKRKNDFFLYREQEPYIFNSSSVFSRWGLNQNYKAGMDYTLNSKNTLGVMVIGNYSDLKGSTISRNIIQDFTSLLTDSILKSDQVSTGFTNNINANLNHQYKNPSGNELNTDFDFSFYDGNRNNKQPNVYTLPDGETILSSRYNRFSTFTTINIYTLKSDYSGPLLKGKLGMGYKLSGVTTDNDYDFYEIIGANEILDNSRSNHFVYTENVYATYVNYQRTVKKFDFQFGLRTEYTFSEGDLKSAADTANDKNVKRNYFDFFPSGGVTLNMNKDNAFALIYSRRINRPNYQELNPFEFKIDELSFRKGNPFLNPQYSNKLEVSYTYKYSTTVGAGYSRTTDFFAQIPDTLPGGRSQLMPKNLATEDILSVDISTSKQIFKWLSVYLRMGLYNQQYKADFGSNKTIDASVTNFNLYGQNSVKIPYNFTLEISGWYNSAGVWGGAYVTKPQGSLDLGLQKKLFNDQATAKIAYTDIFETAPWDSRNVYAGIVIRANGNWESRQLRASITWRFGNSQMKGLKQRTGGSESEQKRIGGE